MEKYIKNSFESISNNYEKLNIEGYKKEQKKFIIESSYEKVYRNIIIISETEEITKKVLIAIKTVQYLDIQHDKIVIIKSDNIQLINKRDLILVINEDIKKDELIISYKGVLKVKITTEDKIESFIEKYNKIKFKIENETSSITKEELNILIKEYENESKLKEDIQKYYKTVLNIKELNYKNNKIECKIEVNLSPDCKVNKIKELIKEINNKLELTVLEIKEGYKNKLNSDIYKVLKKDKKIKAYDKEIINSDNLKSDNIYVINDNIENIVNIIKNLQ